MNRREIKNTPPTITAAQISDFANSLPPMRDSMPIEEWIAPRGKSWLTSAIGDEAARMESR